MDPSYGSHASSAAMSPTHYRITVAGRLSETLESAFEGLSATPSAAGTVLRGDIADQAALFAVLERIESLGLELLAVSRSEAA
jgi:hypothetical protein